MSDQKENKDQSQNQENAEEKQAENSAADSNGDKGDKENKTEDVEIPEKFKDLVESIEKMTVIELNELVKLLEKKFGVSAAQIAQAPAGDASAGGDAEEKSIFNVELSDAGSQKIAVIKIVKEVSGLGLKEAKDLVDSAPAILKEGLKKEEAEEVKKKIEEAGGKVELK